MAVRAARLQEPNQTTLWQALLERQPPAEAPFGKYLARRKITDCRLAAKIAAPDWQLAPLAATASGQPSRPAHGRRATRQLATLLLPIFRVDGHLPWY